MNGAISDVCAFSRSTPAGSSSISTSCGSATAASVPSNGRYANDAVEPTMATPITTTHVKDDEDLIFEIRCLIRTPLLRSPFKASDGTPTRRPAPAMPHAPREKADPATERNRKCVRLGPLALWRAADSLLHRGYRGSPHR